MDTMEHNYPRVAARATLFAILMLLGGLVWLVFAPSSSEDPSVTPPTAEAALEPLDGLEWFDAEPADRSEVERCHPAHYFDRIAAAIPDSSYASLDADTRDQMLTHVRAALTRTRATTLIVTHTEAEAAALGATVLRLAGQPAQLV